MEDMDTEIPVLSGFLNVPTEFSGFSLNRISKKKNSQRYCLLFKSSCHGVKRLEIGESKEDKNPKIITLENCVKITQQPPPANLIQIVKQSGTLTLNAPTEEDLKEWVSALQTVAFRDKSSTSSNIVIEEDNDLYCRSYGDGLFIVTLIPSDASKRCNIEPKVYMLHLTATELQLKLAEDINIEIAKWPYRFIRKYGYRDGKFTFEAGRKCSTGEGVFTLDNTSPQEIFRCMSAKMKSMKKLISGDSSLNSIECGEIQLSVAASMEAGSRSPLPPSPSNQNSPDFDINSSQSCITLRGFISSSDSLNNCPVNNTSSNPASVSSTKHIPNKPPRKLPLVLDKPPPLMTTNQASKAVTPDGKPSGQPNCDKFKKFPNYELVSITSSIDPNKTIGSSVLLRPKSSEDFKKDYPPDLPVRNESVKATAQNDRDYECIEAITEAWKTLGVGDIKHSERFPDPNDNTNDFVWQRISQQREKVPLKETLLTSKTPTIIDIDIGEGGGSTQNSLPLDSTYDRLDYLSPNNKTSSSYKTVVKVTPTSSNTFYNNKQTANDYELIASPEIQTCRKADDSYMGYGVLRKSNTNLDRKNHNNTCYTASRGGNVTVSPLPDRIPIDSTLNVAAASSSDVKTLDHHNYNGLDYTIVSKPKRV